MNQDALVVQRVADEVIDSSVEEDADLGTPVRYTISSYGADYPVDGLVKRIDRADVYVPEFQRGFIWTYAQASRFVESLLLGLPVPGIFLFKEADTGKLVVVDGQQRLKSLQAFYGGILRGREFSLRGVCDDLESKTYKSLSDEDRRRLDDSILHATIFQQDDPEDDRSSIYLIFERLNTGGTPLAPQEIRSCVYRGPFNDLLSSLSHDPHWRTIYGEPSARAKDQELILRFLALFDNGSAYDRPMKGFLNSYMESKRRVDPKELARLKSVFEETLRTAAEHLGGGCFRPERNLNAAVTDALLTALARRLQRGPITEPARLKPTAMALLADDSFLQLVTSGTTSILSVSHRLAKAQQAFEAIP